MEEIIYSLFEQRIKEKLYIRFDYYFWECFVVFCCINWFVVLNPHYLHIQVKNFFIQSFITICSLHFHFKLTTTDCREL